MKFQKEKETNKRLFKKCRWEICCLVTPVVTSAMYVTCRTGPAQPIDTFRRGWNADIVWSQVCYILVKNWKGFRFSVKYKATSSGLKWNSRIGVEEILSDINSKEEQKKTKEKKKE
jgi:hypothetical protein